jgi:hypothetical protein
VCDSSCTDSLLDGDETDIDCGGSCPGCLPGHPCNKGTDCLSKICTDSGTCAAPTCNDGVTNGSESDVDCGGTTCAACANGRTCNSDADCVSAGCLAGVCADKLVISQLRTRGPMGDGDDFVELYNPGAQPVTVDATWRLGHQSADGGCQAPVTRFSGGGQVIPPHKHLLLVGPSYSGAVAPDAMLQGTGPMMSIEDAGSVWLSHGTTKVVDAICFNFDATTQGTISGGCNIAFNCEGMQVSNLPHDGTSSATSKLDVSLERKPGGSLGNGQDTNNNAVDFQSLAPSKPRNLASPPAP